MKLIPNFSRHHLIIHTDPRWDEITRHMYFCNWEPVSNAVLFTSHRDLDTIGLCLLVENPSADPGIQVHCRLIEAYCWECAIPVIKVSITISGICMINPIILFYIIKKFNYPKVLNNGFSLLPGQQQP